MSVAHSPFSLSFLMSLVSLCPPRNFYKFQSLVYSLRPTMTGASVSAATHRDGLQKKDYSIYIHTHSPTPNRHPGATLHLPYTFYLALSLHNAVHLQLPTRHTPIPTCRAAQREWARTSSAACAPGSGAPLAISNTCVSSSATHKTRRAGEYSRLYTPGA